MHHIYMDESKRGDYLMAAIVIPETGLATALDLADKMAGKHKVHMAKERHERQKELAQILARSDLRAAILNAGRDGTERVRRDWCLRAASLLVAPSQPMHILLDDDRDIRRDDIDQLRRLSNARGGRDHLRWTHAKAHGGQNVPADKRLIIPDVVAWCWGKGGHQREWVRSLVQDCDIKTRRD